MIAARFEKLLGHLLDGNLTPDESHELAAALRTDHAQRRELRAHLFLWELWSQHQAPERSAEAFVAACQTRLRAERQAESFVSEMTRRIAPLAARPDAKSDNPLVQFWRALQRPAGLAWTAVSASLMVALLYFAPARNAHATSTTLRGEAICTTCMLHETHDHQPAIRVHTGDTATTYYVRSNPGAVQRLGDYCSAPLPIVATGTTEIHDGRHLISIQLAENNPFSAPSSSTPPSNESALFPF